MNPIPDFRPDITWEEAQQMQREREAAQLATSWKVRYGGKASRVCWTETFYLGFTVRLALKRVYRRVWPFQLWKKPLL
jgi:hypothetical protein